MNSEERKKIEQFCSYILRHSPEAINIKMDKDGYINVKEFIEKTQNYSDMKPYNFDINVLEEIVNNSDKKRFSFNEDKTFIRANQGHSLKKVDIEFKEWKPNTVVYHGSMLENKELIASDGLKKMGRKFVHLTLDTKTAIANGNRFNGSYILYEINALQMHKDGFQFKISDNNVVLIDNVPSKYLTVIEEYISPNPFSRNRKRK